MDQKMRLSPKSDDVSMGHTMGSQFILLPISGLELLTRCSNTSDITLHSQMISQNYYLVGKHWLEVSTDIYINFYNSL